MADGLKGRRQLAARKKMNQVNKAAVMCAPNQSLHLTGHAINGITRHYAFFRVSRQVS
jgi:hypothetical protein